MSADWLNEELPEPWPTHAAADSPVREAAPHDEVNKSVADHIDATVAIQHVSRGVPQWKRRLSPKQSQHGNIDDLKSMFPDASIDAGTISTTDSSKDSSAMPDYALSRKLKLFGDRDTYTEQRCDNLLTSLQGHPDNTISSNGESLRSDNVVNTFANRSKGDLAARFLKNGENVLSRIRKASMLNLNETKKTKDESLDDLERKLANGTIDTTMDPTNNNNGSTLSTLSSTDWNPNEVTAPSLPEHDAARQLTNEFAQEYSRSRETAAPLTDQFGSLRMNNRRSTPVPTLSSLSTVHSGKMRSATSSTVLHHQPGSMSSTVVPTVQFASPKVPDISTLAIPGESSEEIEEHDLETKPSMNQVNDGSDDIVISTSEPSTEISGRSLDQDPDISRRTPSSRVASEQTTLPTPRIRNIRPIHPQAFDVTFRDGSILERSLPSVTVGNNTTIGNLSIAQRDTTFSGSLYHLAERLSGQSPESLEVADLSNAEIETIKGLNKMLVKVRELDLSHNSIRVLEGLPTNAVRLNISYNLLNRLSSFPMACLTTLDVSHNSLTDLNALKSLRSLVHLNISHNALNNLAGLERLHELETLDISHNRLSGIAISHENLRVLTAGFNPMKNARLNTPQLEELNFDNAQITSIEPVPSVERLSIRNNAAALDFKGWTSLETLYYDGNDAARNCAAISPRIVWWQGNKLNGFAAHMLRGAHEVALAGPGLDLSVFVDVYPCQELSLCNMGLQQLPSWLPKRFPLVRALNIAFNSIDDDSLMVISQFRHLEELSLFHNCFSDAQKIGRAFRRLPRLRALDLRANPVTGFYPEIIFNSQQPPLAAYEEVLDQDWSSKGPDYEVYAEMLGLSLQWLDGANFDLVVRPGHSRSAGSLSSASEHSHTSYESQASTSVHSPSFATPARRKPSEALTDDRFTATKAEPDMTARGLSTPPRKDVVRQMARDLIALYDLACRQHPDLYGPSSRHYIRS